MLNQYAVLALETWRQHAPARVAALEDQESFFAELGEQAAAQIAALTEKLEESIPQDLPYLERVGQMRMARKQAEEVVLAELVFGPIEGERASELDELVEMLGELPGWSGLYDRIEQIKDQAQEQAEREGWDRVIYSHEDQAELTRLEALMPLVQIDPAVMSEAEISEAIAKLRPFLLSPL